MDTRLTRSTLTLTLALCPLLTCFLFSQIPEKQAPEAKLWVLNSSQEDVQILRFEVDGEKTHQKTLTPGNDTIITTTIGQKFLIVGKTSGLELPVESKALHQGLRFDPDAKNGIPSFYTQRKEVSGFPIIGSAKVNPYALEEAAYIVQKMLAQREDLLTAMANSGARLCIFAHDEFTTDLPEFAHFADFAEEQIPGIKNKEFWDARARGTGGSITDPFCSCGEENLLGFPGDPYSTESIMVHEFAHNVHLRGMVNVDSTFDDRLQKAYRDAMKKGLWKDKYAATNHFEYFAEGAQSWFGNNRENDHDHNHVNTREELEEYDPALTKLCEEVFGDNDFVYTKPETRLTEHLKGYDPSKAPAFAWPERLLKAKEEIRRQALAADPK